MLEFVLIFVALIAPVTSVGFLIVALIATVAHRRLWPRPLARRWLYLAGLLFASAGILYGFALFESGTLASPKSCRPPLASSRVDHGHLIAVESGMFPLQFVCRFADGTVIDWVPWWFNPLEIGILVAALTCLATASSVAWRAATRPRCG